MSVVTPHIRKAELIEGTVYVASQLFPSLGHEQQAQVLEVLQAGLASAEHGVFVQRLQGD